MVYSACETARLAGEPADRPSSCCRQLRCKTRCLSRCRMYFWRRLGIAFSAARLCRNTPSIASTTQSEGVINQLQCSFRVVLAIEGA